MKILTKIAIVLGLFLSLTIYLGCDAFFIAPSRYTTHTVNLESEKIPAALNDLRIVCFSDVDYGEFTDEKRLEKLVRHINDLSPDIVLFCGDLYDTGYKQNDADNAILAEKLKAIEAPYGKFAVLGDRDSLTEVKKEAVQEILYAGNFELLANRSIPLHYGGTASITLVGLENGINGAADINAAYANVSRNAYVITMCHTPDTADHVPGDLTDRFIAGHTHGGQAFWGFGSLFEVREGSYLRGSVNIRDEFTLDITNGTGTTGKDVRFLANAETVLYVLKNTSEVQEEEPSVIDEQKPEDEITPEEPEDTDDQADDSEDYYEDDQDDYYDEDQEYDEYDEDPEDYYDEPDEDDEDSEDYSDDDDWSEDNDDEDSDEE